MERAGIPLHDAPERYSDQEKWGEIVRIVGNRDAAIAFVSRPTFGDFFNLSPLASAIRCEFIERLVNGSLVATGCFPNSVDVLTIPGSRCLGLRPEFVTDRLIGNNRSSSTFACLTRRTLSPPAQAVLTNAFCGCGSAVQKTKREKRPWNEKL
jgi:hypothetical protein